MGAPYGTTKPSSLTLNQRRTLLIAREKSSAGMDLALQPWVPIKETHAPAAAVRLVRMGLLEERVEYGPKGGKKVFVRPTPEGKRVADYIKVNRLKTY